jgi:hypothetical protein
MEIKVLKCIHILQRFLIELSSSITLISYSRNMEVCFVRSADKTRTDNFSCVHLKE